MWLIDQVRDCHVICESLAPAAEYTGERVWLSEQYPMGLARPPKQVTAASVEGLEAYLESLESSVDIIRDAIEAIQPGSRARRGLTDRGKLSLLRAQAIGVACSEIQCRALGAPQPRSLGPCHSILRIAPSLTT